MSHKAWQENYHNQRHLKDYDVESVWSEYGIGEQLIEEINEILYPEGKRPPSIDYQEPDMAISYFSQQYFRDDTPNWSEAKTLTTVDMKYVRFLGQSALERRYELVVEEVVYHRSIGFNSTANQYWIEQINHVKEPFRAYLQRPLFSRDANRPIEVMTQYDCKKLLETLKEVSALAKLDNASHDLS